MYPIIVGKKKGGKRKGIVIIINIKGKSKIITRKHGIDHFTCIKKGNQIF